MKKTFSILFLLFCSGKMFSQNNLPKWLVPQTNQSKHLVFQYFRVDRKKIGKGTGVQLNTNFNYLNLFDNSQRFAPDEPSSFSSLEYNFLKRKLSEKIGYGFSAGVYRNHIKGDLLLDKYIVHFGRGNSQVGLSASTHLWAQFLKTAELSFSFQLGAGPHFTKLTAGGNNVDKKDWGIRGWGISSNLSAWLTSPVFFKRVSLSGGFVVNYTYSNYQSFTIEDAITGEYTKYDNIRFSTIIDKPKPTVAFRYNLYNKNKNTPIRSNDFLSNNKKNNTDNKGRIYAHWGWNRGYYTKSNIHFSGNGHDFVLKDVTAKDRQSEFSFRTYFHPAKFTIPQTNYGIGYYFKNNYILTLGVDHMKYVVQRPQEVLISGNINGEGLPYQGNYNDNKLTLRDDFLKMEHTDGLNYLSIGILRSDNILKNKKAFENKLQLNVVEGIGAGAMIPKSDVTLLSKMRNDQYRLSGFGISANAGLQLILFNHFFLRGEIKSGFINLTSIKTSPDDDRAKQHFYFFQPSGQFGWSFYLGK